MSVHINGNNKAARLFIGGQDISKAYTNGYLIFGKTAPGPRSFMKFIMTDQSEVEIDNLTDLNKFIHSGQAKTSYTLEDSTVITTSRVADVEIYNKLTWPSSVSYLFGQYNVATRWSNLNIQHDITVPDSVRTLGWAIPIKGKPNNQNSLFDLNNVNELVEFSPQGSGARYNVKVDLYLDATKQSYVNYDSNNIFYANQSGVTCDKFTCKVKDNEQGLPLTFATLRAKELLTESDTATVHCTDFEVNVHQTATSTDTINAKIGQDNHFINFETNYLRSNLHGYNTSPATLEIYCKNFKVTDCGGTSGAQGFMNYIGYIRNLITTGVTDINQLFNSICTAAGGLSGQASSTPQTNTGLTIPQGISTYLNLLGGFPSPSRDLNFPRRPSWLIDIVNGVLPDVDPAAVDVNITLISGTTNCILEYTQQASPVRYNVNRAYTSPIQ